MDIKTNFSFELYYTDQSASSESQRGGVMRDLGPSLQNLLTVTDSAAKVTVSDSQKGDANKLIEVITKQPEADMYAVIKKFCDANGVTIAVLE